MSGAPESSVAEVGLKTWLEVEMILCTEYRYVWLLSGLQTQHLSHLLRESYSSIVSLIGEGIFDVVADLHQQRTGVSQAEDIKIANMIERIECAAE